MRDKLLRRAAMWLQIEEVAHEPAVHRYARRQYERCMNRLNPQAVVAV